MAITKSTRQCKMLKGIKTGQEIKEITEVKEEVER